MPDDESKRERREGESSETALETFVVSVNIRVSVRLCSCMRVLRLAVQSWFSLRQAFCPEDRAREAGEVDTAILAACTILSLPRICASHSSVASRACVSRNSATGFLLLPLRRRAVFFFLSFVFFFLFYFAHPLTRAAGRFQQKCDTNGAIQI